MYLQSNPESMLGQGLQVFSCSVDAVLLDDFLVGDYRLRPSHYEKLMGIRELAQFMRNSSRPISISLEGFTDSSGKEVMNKGLSVSRAAEVQNFLARVGVDVHSAVGSGESNPKASNATEAGRRKNRRVELRVCVQLPPPPPGGSYNLTIASLMRQMGRPTTGSLAGTPTGRTLVDEPKYTKLMVLDRFNLNDASLTPHLQQLVKELAKRIQQSGASIGFIRLKGHTDNTGKHEYNVQLGNRRAEAVRGVLDFFVNDSKFSPLPGFMRKPRRTILVDQSPGEREPVADNSTPQGRELNRRVEVFVAPYRLQITDPPPPSNIRTQPDPYGFNKKLPELPPGKSFEQWVDERLARVPKLIRDQMKKAFFDKDWGLMGRLLDAAGIGGPAKEVIIGIARQASQTKVR